jgi:threonine dehydrogenase-like Zn-dependent dehydrogenase
MRVDNVDDPKLEAAGDANIRITSTAICGSDLHLYHGYMPGMQTGDVVGHEPMGEVVEAGRGVQNLKVGMAAVMNKALILRTGQTHVQRYLPLLLEKIIAAELDPS